MDAAPSAAPSVKAMMVHAEDPPQCEFYKNIWNLEGQDDDGMRKRTRGDKSAGTRRRRHKKRFRGPLIDISQVAHVVTSMSDYRQEYAPLELMSEVNVWANDSLILSDSESDNDQDDLKQRRTKVYAGIEDTDPDKIMSPIESDPRPFRISEVTEEDDDEEPDRAPSVSLDDPIHGDEDKDVKRGLKRGTTPVIRVADVNAQRKTQYNMPSIDSAVPPPSLTNGGSVVFSSVFTQERREWNWAAKFLLSVHEPIRHALFVMDRFLEQTHRASDVVTLEGHVTSFFVWFKTYFAEYLRSQHEIKKSVLLPLLTIKSTTKQEILHTYEDIYASLDQIQEQERALYWTGGNNDFSLWQSRLDLLQREVRRLNLTLYSVLNLEENTLSVALTDTFTHKTFHSYVMPRIFRSIKAKRVVVPWILERSKVWGGQEEQRSIQGMLPFSAKFMYRKIWRPYFMSNVAFAMKNLNEFVDTSPSSPFTSDQREDTGCSIQ